jgi:hypothetical protein
MRPCTSEEEGEERRPSRVQRLHELMSYRVVQSVNEFALAEEWEFVYLALHPEMACDLVLRKL